MRGNMSIPSTSIPSANVTSTAVTWSPERVEQLRAFVGAGMTCSQIAAEIGVSRNAVIGKIHRLGLGPGRPAAALGRVCPPRTQRPRVPSQRQMLRVIRAEAPQTGGAVNGEAPIGDAIVGDATPGTGTQNCSLLELGHGKCRWPVSERSGSAADFVFCGNPIAGGFSYCAAHARMAYRTPERRRA
jgi:GcrA cell cycle regulator